MPTFFAAIGKTITYCGQSGAGYTVKLCNQILGGLHLLAAAEALTLADKAGIDLNAMLQAVSCGAAGPKPSRPFSDWKITSRPAGTWLAVRVGMPRPRLT